MTVLEILRINRAELERQLAENSKQTATLHKKRNIIQHTLTEIGTEIARLNNTTTQENLKG